MTPAEYVLDHRFELLGAACAFDDEPFRWLEDEDLQAWAKSVEDEPTIVFSHNQLFDATISDWHLGMKPLLWSCTLSMARGVLNGTLRRFSLSSVSEHLGLGTKGTTIHNLRGVNRAMLRANPQLYADTQAYAIQDGHLCREIERALRPSFPVQEYLVIDTLIRAVTEPMFRLNMGLVYAHIAAIKARNEELLQAVAMDDTKALMSNEKFAQKLIELGVEPPMKISKTTGLETYAFAKTDQAMTDLAEHEDPAVGALVAARLGHKSTMEETRSHRFISVAQACQGLMPVPLKYSGAHTHRFSGDWKLNMQNLSNKVPVLKQALEAIDDDHVVVEADASQIEARLGAWLAGWTWLLDQFADPKQDPYSNYAKQLFPGVQIAKGSRERFVGKQSILSLQYGASWVSFQRMCRTMGGLLLTEEEARLYVSKYRQLAHPITAFWKLNSTLIEAMAAGNMVTHKCLFTRKEEIRLPSGLALRYPDLRYVRIPREHNMPSIGEAHQKFSGWRYGKDDEEIGLFGGKLMENQCQALARIIVTDAGKRIFAKHKLRYKLQVHDSLVYVVPKEMGEWLKGELIAELSRPVSWAPGLVLAAEGGVGRNYGDCK
jgi:DNA polymerase